MANYAIQLRRGTSGEHSSFTGLVGEITVNTSNNSIHVHDGSTAGGHELAKQATVANLSSDTIIDADSDTSVKVEASADSDTIDFTVAGTTIAKFESTGLIPSANVTYDLGSSSNQWRDLYLSNATIVMGGSEIGMDANGDMEVKDSGTGNLKKLIIDEIQMGTGAGAVKLKKGNNGKLAVTNVSDAGTGGSEVVDDTSPQLGGDLDLNSNNITGTGNINTTGSITISGDLTVNGTTTTVNSTTLSVADPLIILNEGATGANANDLGMVFERGSSTNTAFIYDESADEFAFVNTTEDGTTAGDITISTYADIHAGTMTGTATAAQYADVAERYHSGIEMEAGTVVCFGGDNEIEACKENGCTRVAGVISTAPAFMMNKDAGDDATHPYVALAGRVPCKVTGTVKKGDMLMASDKEGHAKAGPFKGGAMIGKAIEDFDGESGVIEVAVNLM